MSIPKAEHDELCCVYAGLLLSDENLEVTADKINKILAASGNTVDGYYPEFFERFFKSNNINTLLSSIGSAGAGPAEGASAEKKDDKAGAAKAGAKDDKKDDKKGGKKEVKKEEPPAEEDAEMFGNLF